MAKIQKRTGGLSAVRARAKARAVPTALIEETTQKVEDKAPAKSETKKAQVSASKKRKTRLNGAEPRKGTSFHLSTETAAALTEYLQNNFVYTGETLTKGEAVAQAFQQYMPTVAEAKNIGQPLENLKMVMVNLPASARLAMTKAEYVTRADGVRVTRNWYYNEAVKRWLADQ